MVFGIIGSIQAELLAVVAAADSLLRPFALQSAASSFLLPCVALSSPSPVIVGRCVALPIFQSSAVVHRLTGLARRSRGGRPGVTMLDDILHALLPYDRLMFKFFLIYMMQNVSIQSISFEGHPLLSSTAESMKNTITWAMKLSSISTM